MSNKPLVFVITPFNDDFLALYRELKERFADNFEFKNAGDLDNQQSILEDIVVGIYSADVIIADLTGLNPNVFYELGLAHAMNKKVIIITQDIDELPFDLKPYRANQYSLLFYKISELYTQLEKLLHGAINGNIQFGSPVSDYVKDAPKQEKKELVSSEVSSEISKVDESDDDEDRGFLDFIADIEEAMGATTSEIEAMQNNMAEMTSEIESAAIEINRAKNIGGSSTAIIARNISRKLSQPVNVFASQLKNHISIISDNWGVVENNYLALLSDGRIFANDNLKNLKSNTECLEDLQIAIRTSDVSIEGFINSLKASTRLERRLTKAITILIEELQAYLSMTTMMASSIDRIIAKSKIVLEVTHI